MLLPRNQHGTCQTAHERKVVGNPDMQLLHAMAVRTGQAHNNACMRALRAGVFDAADTGRFYISMLNYTLAGGLHLGTSQLLLAASASGDPTEGFLGPFRCPACQAHSAAGL